MTECYLHEESTVKAEPIQFDRVRVKCREAKPVHADKRIRQQVPRADR